MQTLVQMLLPGAVLPLFLSAVLYWLSKRYAAALWGLPFIWLPSYVWLNGRLSLFPKEAKDWLWLLAVSSVVINIAFKLRCVLNVTLQTTLLALVLAAVVWPVLQYQFNMVLLIEIIIVTVAGFTFYRISITGEVRRPALSLAISSGGMGLVVALGGSLLIGQLAGALAAVLAAFAVDEVICKLQKPASCLVTLVPFMQLYLVILVIAHVFAEIPLGPSLLLLVAPLAGLIPVTRFSPAFSAVCVIASISWLLLTADPSSYY